MFRKQAKAFAADHMALSLSKKILADEKMYDEYMIYEKAFVLLPLEHSEDGRNTR
mgnify:CR=1 FL=1